MSDRTRKQNDSSHDGRVDQLGQEGSIVSGRQSARGATKTLHRLHSSSQHFDNMVPVSERCNTSEQSVAEAGHHAADSTMTASPSAQRPPSVSGQRPPSASGHRPRSVSSQRPPSASGQRPPTAAGRRHRAVRHNITDSYVDESLFGPVTDCTFAVSRQPKQRPVKPFLFDCTDYKAKASSTNSSTNVPSSRPSSQRSARSRPRSARLHSQPSFVDESLFGNQLELTTWRAPWDKKDCRPKPFIFDATNYREKQQQTSNSDSRFQRASAENKGSTKQLPPWR